MSRNLELLLLNCVCVCVHTRACVHVHAVSGNRKAIGKKAYVSQMLKESKTIFP